MSRVRSVLLVLDWLPSYDRKWLRPDILAGITVAAFTVPEAMAYGSLAGLPPEAGLYAALFASLLYVVFGTSRQLAMGPTSALSILVAGGLRLARATGPVRDVLRAEGFQELVGPIAADATVAAAIGSWRRETPRDEQG